MFEENRANVPLAERLRPRSLDEVAYLRFASVYQAFSSIDDFEKAISDLRVEHRQQGP